jgi:hypothetical protein
MEKQSKHLKGSYPISSTSLVKSIIALALLFTMWRWLTFELVSSMMHAMQLRKLFVFGRLPWVTKVQK